MRRAWMLATASLFLSQFLVRFPVLAASFADVASNHQYRAQIETLGDRGVIKGNPDGTFKAEKTVNRAEMLTFLYRATGKAANVPTKQCMKDVPAGEWYATVVCDAITRGYVSGYPDGNFRPGQEVNRVEALKMIQTVFGFTVNGNESLDPLKAYGDVSLTAWYAPYIAGAFDREIIPIAGQIGPQFFPDKMLLRGEAAAYIFNALGLKLRDQASSAASSADASSSVTTRRSSASDADASSSDPFVHVDVDFPFSDDGTFAEKLSKAYVFSLNKPLVGTFEVRVDAAHIKNGVTCRLYKLEKDTAFALEYYIGHKIDNRCVVRAALSAGEYQLEITPTMPDIHYEVFVNDVNGDANDGFRQAQLLLSGKPKTSALETDDHGDWFWFKLEKKQKLSVYVTNADNLACIIYPMADVDLFGFSGPACNAEYDFPAGTYYVGVQRRDEEEEKQSFTIRYE